MSDLRCVTLHFFFKVLDAEIFGGYGTEGYVSTTNGEAIGSAEMHFDNMVSIDGFNDICEAYRKLISMQMEISIDKVIPISRDEYKENTEECNE